MPHNYFDIETTGLDPERDEIISIQYQKIALDSGHPEEELTILKSWEQNSNEKKIIEKITSLLMSSNPFSFVPVGNNLDFEFRFLAEKIRKYQGIDVDPGYFHSRPYIDLKPVMILLNGGRFKGYHHILNKTTSGALIPKWYKKKQFEEIINYIVEEASAFTSFYSNVYQMMFNPHLKNIVFNSNNWRIDDFV